MVFTLLLSALVLLNDVTLVFNVLISEVLVDTLLFVVLILLFIVVISPSIEVISLVLLAILLVLDAILPSLVVTLVASASILLDRFESALLVFLFFFYTLLST